MKSMDPLGIISLYHITFVGSDFIQVFIQWIYVAVHCLHRWTIKTHSLLISLTLFVIFGFPLGPGWSVCKLGRSTSPRTSYVGLGCVKICYHGCISGTGALYTVHFYFPMWNIFFVDALVLAQVLCRQIIVNRTVKSQASGMVKENYKTTIWFLKFCTGLIWI